MVASYGYDSQNRRVRKSVGARSTYYVYDLESRLIAELSGEGTVLREYIWLENEPLALREYELRPGLYFYINDHLGTPQQLVDSQGAVVWQAAYLPFGEAQVQLGTVQNNLRFPGQYFDAETGLHYNWHRYYDPDTGRYLSPDPIGLEGGLNLYAYVNNDPVNSFDPEGLAGCYVGYSGYPITIPGTSIKVPLTHAGVLSYNSQGHTRYYEYGRYDHSCLIVFMRMKIA